MREGDPHDPLLRRVWPHAAELLPAAGLHGGPRARARPRRGGRDQQIYGPRAADRERRVPAALPLLLPPRLSLYRAARGSRRLVPRRSPRSATCADAREAILSGGDPLSLSHRRLGDLLARLADSSDRYGAVPHAVSDRDSGAGSMPASCRCAARNAPANGPRRAHQSRQRARCRRQRAPWRSKPAADGIAGIRRCCCVASTTLPSPRAAQERCSRAACCRTTCTCWTA